MEFIILLVRFRFLLFFRWDSWLLLYVTILRYRIALYTFARISEATIHVFKQTLQNIIFFFFSILLFFFLRLNSLILDYRY